MKAIGKITKVTGNTALVVSQRQSACASCHNCEGKGACGAHLIFGDANQEVTVEAENVVCAKAGDSVELEIDTSKTLLISAIIFLVPVLLGCASYFGVRLITDSIGISLISVIGCIALSFAVLGKLVNGYVKKNISINIVKILEESDS